MDIPSFQLDMAPHQIHPTPPVPNRKGIVTSSLK